MAAAVVALSACGGLQNDPFKHGDLVGRVLRGDQASGRVVLMGADPQDTGLDDEGRFHFSSVNAGPHELLVVASDAEALRVPALVAGGQVNDLQDLDPAPAAFIVIDLTTQGTPADCWINVHQTDLAEVHAPDGSYRFVAGPLGAGCYDATMEHYSSGGQGNGTVFWTQSVCLAAGEQHAFNVTW